MKAIITILILLNSAVFSFAQTFEGVIEASTSTKATKEEAVVKWYVKDGNSRMEIKGTADGVPTNAILLFQKGSGKFHLVSVMDGKEVVFPVAMDSVKVAAQANVIAVKVEGTKKIAGYSCYLVKIQSPEGYSECWVSDEVQLSAQSLPPALVSKGIIAGLRANGINGMPLDVVTKDNTGAVQYSFTVKSVRAETVADTLFQLPSGAQDGQETLKKSMKAQ